MPDLMTTITIREATKNDISDIASFQINLASETENVTLEESIVREGLKRLFDEPYRGQYYVAEIDNKVVGCHLITYEWSEWRNGNVWWLQSVYISKDHRKKGVFKKMYDTLIEKIKNDPEILGLRLYVDKTNVPAQKVYEGLAMNGDHYTVYEWMK